MSKLILYMGPMYSGKTSKLIETYNQLTYDKHNVFVIKNKLDNRNNNTNNISSHNNLMLKADYIYDNDTDTEFDFVELKNDYDYIIIDEGQFYKGLKDLVIKLLDIGFIIIIGGLDGDYKQDKFGEMLDLIPIADQYYKLHGICTLCTNPASFTKRIVDNDTQVLVGGAESYIPVCRPHL